LGEFFSRLGITEADCKKAFKDNENGQENAWQAWGAVL
jgi:hypothetical protein